MPSQQFGVGGSQVPLVPQQEPPFSTQYILSTQQFVPVGQHSEGIPGGQQPSPLGQHLEGLSIKL